MSWKQLVVCLLVFAAGATFSLAGIRSIPQIRSRASSLPNVHLINSSHPQARTMPADSPRHAPDIAGTNRIANLPLTFEPNEGQTDANVNFIGRGMGLTVLLTPEGMTIRIPRSADSSASPKVSMRWREVLSGHGLTSNGGASKSFLARRTIYSETIAANGEHTFRISRSWAHQRPCPAWIWWSTAIPKASNTICASPPALTHRSCASIFPKHKNYDSMPAATC